MLTNDGFAVYHPASLRRLADYDWRYGNLDRGMRMHPDTEPPPISFMGAMRRPDGQERLVVVTGGAANGLSLLADVSVLVLPPPALTGSERWDAGRQMSMQRTGQLVMAVLHMGQRDPNNPGRMFVPFSVYRPHVDEPVGRGSIALELGDDDVLRASFAKMEGIEGVDRVGLGVEQLRMAPSSPFPLRSSPWRTTTVMAFQKLAQVPTTRPIDW